MREINRIAPQFVLVILAVISLASPISFANTAADSNQPKLTKHDVALRFLTAYIRRDQNLARKYASPAAVEKMDWHIQHGANIPYYDDKMLLHFSGGYAKLHFQMIQGSAHIGKIDVYRYKNR